MGILEKTARRFSRSNSRRNSQHSRESSGSHQNINSQQTPPTSYNSQDVYKTSSNQYLTNQNTQYNQTNTGTSVDHGNYNNSHSGAFQNQAIHDSRPGSTGTGNSSFEYMNRPTSQDVRTSAGPTTVNSNMMNHNIGPLPTSAMNGLSRTDQLVLRVFWEDKYADNSKRDLHYLKFPRFSSSPSHAELLPYCEIYHLVKQNPGATIMSLGSSDGPYIGFELTPGSQLHIDMDESWTEITHHRIQFAPINEVLRDPRAGATFERWPKPLTLEFLEREYAGWRNDLVGGLCWSEAGVRELGGAGGTPGPASGAGTSAGQNHVQQGYQQGATTTGASGSVPTYSAAPAQGQGLRHEGGIGSGYDVPGSHAGGSSAPLTSATGQYDERYDDGGRR